MASLSAARSRVNQARSLIEVRRYSDVDAAVEAGLEFLVGLPEEEAAETVAELIALRAEAVTLEEEERAAAKIRTAKRELSIAQEDIEKGYITADGISYRFERVRQALESVPDKLKLPLLDEADMLEAILTAREGGSAPAAAQDSEPSGPVLSNDDEVNLSRARSRIIAIRSLVESRRTDGLDSALDEAAGYLAGVPDADRTPLLAQIAELRSEAVRVQRAEYARKIDSEFERQFYLAENVDVHVPRHSAKGLATLTERLAEEKELGRLDPEILAGYESRIATARAARALMLKEAAMERGLPLLADLESRVATDPFAGLDQSAANHATSELEHLGHRAMHEMAELPQDDADVLAFKARVAAAKEKIERASRSWGNVQLHATVREPWEMLQRDPELAGWREESGDPQPMLLRAPELPRTRTAVRRIGWFLADSTTVKWRTDYPDDEVIQSILRQAEDERAAAVAHLAQAYEYVLAEAEKIDTPMNDDDLTQTLHFSGAVRSTFEGTSAEAGLLARTTALDERWKGEGAAVMQGRQDLYDRLAAEAVAAWPAIVAATGAGEDFDPGDTSAAGKVVHLAGVRNRAGWDFKNYDFCMRWDGIPIGGTYEPHVQQALEHAWYELKLDVNDRIAWDVIGVVQGSGKIGERTHKSVKGSNGLEIGKIEEWPGVDCVRMKIIALHAGPVAVGPGHDWRPSA